MEKIVLPQIDYNTFAKTRDTIQLYVQLIIAIKGKLVPHQKNWEEYSLKVYSKGFTTTPIPIQTNDGIESFELNLNLVEHKLKVLYKNNRDEITFENITIAGFTNKLFEILSSYEIELDKPDDKFFAVMNLYIIKMKLQNCGIYLAKYIFYF